MIRTLRCTVQYDGSAFAGFQRQPGRITVQGALEEAIARVTRETCTVMGAGRTDAGVHALGQVIHFLSASSLPLTKLQRGLNACLPNTVVLTTLEEAAPDFHARFDARSREYRYVVENAPIPSALWRQRAHFVEQPLAVEAMDAAARLLEGRHDFAAFGSPMKHPAPHDPAAVHRGGTERSMLLARCRRRNRFVLFGFIADAFLRHMVRMLVGTLLRVGTGSLAPNVMQGLLNGDRSLAAGPAAPAHGLYLVRVRY